MEFKDRVANKPNRVKLTYEDSGASSYAIVELADEPIEEGTPLNALNMNKLLNKEDNDYIIEQGTRIDGLFYELWNSGKAELWGTVTVKNSAQESRRILWFDTLLSWQQIEGIRPVGSVTPCDVESSYTLRSSAMHYFTWYSHTENRLRVGVVADTKTWEAGTEASVDVIIKGRWK